jgi:REP element-mobilizing transposase RayT
MSAAKTKIWIHTFFSTKNRLPLINNDFSNDLLKFLSEELNNLGCTVDSVNGTADHVHLLFLLNSEKSLNEIIEFVKKNSSESINNKHFPSGSFAWDEEFSAFSVSESQISKVQTHIHNQQEHHKKQSFLQERNEFLRLNGIQ